MPIRYRDYPSNWFTDIRPRILARAGNCCEECSVPNHAYLWRKRWPDRRFYGTIRATATAPAVVVGAEHAAAFRDYAAVEIKQKRVKLAIAHLDHDTKHNADDNLRALCQWCHLRHDRRDNWRRRLYGKAVATGQLIELDFTRPCEEAVHALAVVASSLPDPVKKPPLTFYRRLDWGASLERCKAFFDRFPYDDFNARKREEDKADEQIHHRKANIEGTFGWIFHLVLKGINRRQASTTPIYFPLTTKRGGLATRLRRAKRTIDRHLDALLDMGALEQSRPNGRGLELIISPSLFVFTAAPTAPAGPPVPAAPATVVSTANAVPTAPAAADGPEPPLDPWMLTILRNTAIAEKMAQKFGVLAAPAPA